MRVLMFAWEWPPNMVGGLGKHVVELLPQLVDQDIEVHLITPRLRGDYHDDAVMSARTGRPAENGSHFYRVDPFPYTVGNFYTNTVSTNIMLEAAAQQLIDQIGGFDLIHAHDWLVSFAAIGVKHSRRLPLVATIHATEMGRQQGVLQDEMQQEIHKAEWQLAYESWRVIATSNYMAWEIENYFGNPRDKIDVIPNGVDPWPYDRFKDQDLSEFRRSLALPREKIVFYVGRLVWEKGLQVLVDAAPQIVSIYPNVKFVVAGGGDFRFDLERRANERGVGAHFYFPGRISDDDRDRLYRVADVAVFPSLYEPFGIVALEAMAAGTPVVASDTGGLAEVITLHENGLKVHPDDPGSLAWGILHTLLHEDWARQRAANARRDVDTLYNWDRIARMTKETYEKVITAARADSWAYFGHPSSAESETPSAAGDGRVPPGLARGENDTAAPPAPAEDEEEPITPLGRI